MSPSAAAGQWSRRVCVELLPPVEAAHPAVRELLVRAGVAPMLAAQATPVGSAGPGPGDRAAQADADAAVAQALARYRADGLSPCVWPLLRDQDGYWPSAYNAEAACARVRALLQNAARAGAPLCPGDTVAIDLEPPLGRGAWTLLSGCPAGRFAAATQALRTLCDELRAQGIVTLAVAYPLVSADRAGPVWQRRCVAPLGAGWDRVGIMTYSSMIAGYSRGLLSVRAARRYGYQAQAALSRRFPGASAAFIGTCGTGKLGDEPAHTDPEALRLDAAAARAAGAVEVTAFCLEGMLQQPDPLRWLQALDTPAREPPKSALGDLCHLSACGLSAGLAALIPG